ncbi:type II toxin-antitoxin system PemK/MazF family toxin [Jiangella rhizosphaerae]|uniref:Type II toxin-antitoxin system PemK/MazF family toxin n=1 Tax=Jiangella rhizosphaerae TaxID=2293569 RepID=A0A418KIP5_9ACTN|nr:type II toxin-antitoxin system PemK/MazF family toxin [Jiangella rhizosphaerae]RIQ13624.1 type II toxin-antitoxin system PemK/MazF family toxin [Jiangella rhizosphaerae]
MRRGEVWTSAGPGHASKPRPVVIVQDDRFDATDSVTVALMTTDRTELPLFRIPVEPAQINGLKKPSSVMADKIMTVRRDQLGERVGRLTDEDMVRLNRALVVFLGIAG